LGTWVRVQLLTELIPDEKFRRLYYFLCMRKIILLLLSITCISQAALGSDKKNPFFGDRQNQVALQLGTGVDSGFLIPPPLRYVPFSIVQLQYSQATTFFKLPARQSLNIAHTIGFDRKYGWDWNEYSIPMAFVSGDVALLSGERWYFGTGFGAGMQAKENARIGSKLLFQFKMLFGYRITDSINGELFMLHISNGNTAPANNSYAFYGLGLLYNF